MESNSLCQTSKHEGGSEHHKHNLHFGKPIHP